MLRTFLASVLLVSLPLSSRAEIPVDVVSNAIQFKVEKFKLSNGLTVLLHEDHTVPIITYHQWFRVGSRNEKVGRTGLAHFFEHLMFKGTQKYPGKIFDKIIQANGGANNAFTSRDYTGYYTNVPSDKLELIVDIESDRMRNLLFDEKEINSEREVVKEERRFRVENSVYGSLDEAIYKTVYKTHPYHWPVIGYMTDLNAATINDMKEFYRIHYAPNNAVVVIVGAFQTSNVRKMIEKYYGSIPSQALAETKIESEPEQKEQRNLILRKDVQNPTVAVVFRAPAAGTEDSYTFDLLSNILANGPSSRLFKRLVYHEQTVTDISAWAYTPKDPGLFEVTASLKPGGDPDKVIASIYSELYKVRNKLVDAKELEKAKNQIMSNYVKGLKSAAGKAQAMAVNEILFGDYTEMFRDLGRYNKVTVEQIKALAEKYLNPEQRSVFKVLPKAAAQTEEQKPTEEKEKAEGV